ncbi:hypothetical protein EON77_12050, partial [bacterium]
MSRPELRHLDREPYDEATRERVWARLDRARLQAALPKQSGQPLRRLGLAFVASAAVAVALAWPA